MNLCIWPIILLTILVALFLYLKLFSIEGEIKTKKKASSKIEMKISGLLCLWDSSNLCYFIVPAVYLCKRTMQNKARLELADYEAVSTWGKVNISAGPNEHAK